MFIIQKIFNENGWTRIVVGKENLSLWKPRRHMWRAVSFIPRLFYRRENNPHYQLNGMMVVLQRWTGRFEVKRYRTTNPRSACT